MTKVSSEKVTFLPPYRPRGPRTGYSYEDEGTLEDILEDARNESGDGDVGPASGDADRVENTTQKTPPQQRRSLSPQAES